MNNAFDFFDKIYCVNLPESKDRWNLVSKEFEKLNILHRVERIWVEAPPYDFKMSSLTKPPGEFGVWLSHMKALIYSINNKNENYLLFEDDVAFIKNTPNILNESLKILPSDWDIFFIGGRPLNELKIINKNLAKNKFFYGGYSYAVNSKSFIDFFNAQFNNISKNTPRSTIDGILGTFCNEKNSYCTIPPLCKNIPGESIIRKSYRNYDKLTNASWEKYL